MNYKISLPEIFEEGLKKSEFITPLNHALERFSEVLDNGDHLFREYTDHSPSHIQDVLDTAANIIQGESHELLTSEDIYVLVIAICLHDSAMTFTWEDLQAVVSEEKYNARLFGYKPSEEPSWKKLWEAYKVEFSNFTENDLRNIIGDDLPSSNKLTDHFPNIHDNNLTRAQLKVAGEFVRRHHARLAHSIAVSGYPRIELDDLFHNDKRRYNDLAGFIARSHHHSMREMYNRLTQDQKQEHRKCHLVFLMAVLRIADLMQITSKRTPLLTFKSKIFWSSYSENEWKRHLSMLHYKEIFRDPACIFCEIDSSIDSVKMLHSIRTLLNYFQHELDMVWASLGEAYGENQLSNLKIKYRRVSSELDSHEFISELPFEDSPAEFRVDLSLIKKLITPLYGNFPEIGVRELLQNALDTTRERQHLASIENNRIKVSVTNYDQYGEFEIIDYGCGMDTTIIRDFFLCIGSSFRSSKQWATEFLKEQQSQINRSGRFGIGMLAGFILGDEIEVTTRRFDFQNKDHTIQFKFNLNSGLIQLNKIPLESAHIGTTIKIRTNNDTYERLKNNPAIWQWYYQLDKDAAEVEYIIDGAKQQTQTQSPQDFWTSIPSLHKIFPNFKWARRDHHPIGRGMLFVNNLKISSSADTNTNYQRTLDSYDDKQKFWAYDIAFPPVTLEDPNLKLPLNLERNGFSETEVPYGRELYSNVVSSYLKEVNDYDQEPLDIERDQQTLSNIFCGLSKNTRANQQVHNSQIGLWGLHKEGFIFSEISLVKAARIERIYVISQRLNSREVLDKLPCNSAIFKVNGERFVDKYVSRTRVNYKEATLLNLLKSNNFLSALFGASLQLELPESSYSLTIDKERFEDIASSTFLNSQNISSKEGANTVSMGSSTTLSNLDIPMKSTDYIIGIEINNLSDTQPKGLLSERWLSELSSPLLNKATKLKV